MNLPKWNLRSYILTASSLLVCASSCNAITLEGRVTAEVNGLPVAGASVHVWHEDLRVYQGTSTDSNGDWSVTGVPAGYIDLEVYPVADYAADGLEADFQTDTSAIDFALAEECTISGTVRSMSTQQALAGVRVQYERDNPDLWFNTTTDSEGRFYLGTLPTGGQIKAVPDPGQAYNGAYYASYGFPVDLEPGDHLDFCPVVVQEGALVSGVVRDSSGNLFGPLDDWDVWSVNGSGIEVPCSPISYLPPPPDPVVHGYLMRLPVGRHRIAVDGDVYLAAPHLIEITSPSDDQTVDFTVYDASASAEIEGTIDNPDSHAVQSGTELAVMATLQSGGLFAVTSIEEINLFEPFVFLENFEFGDSYSVMVPPDEDYHLVLFLGGPEGSYVSRDSVAVTAGAAGSVTTGLDLVYDSEGGTVSGAATLNGEPTSGLVVLLTRSSGEFAGVNWPGEDGRFAFYNVPTGDYLVQAGHPTYGNSPKVPVNGIADGGTFPDVNLEITTQGVSVGIALSSPATREITFDSVADCNYRIETSIDLMHWFTVFIEIGDGSTMSWTDLHPERAHKFYRTILIE